MWGLTPEFMQTLEDGFKEFFANMGDSYTFEGSAGFEKMQNIMVSFRKSITEFAGKKVLKCLDYIIMFIPFGFLAPMVFERMRKVRFCVFIGFLCSCGIELSQLITQRGYCQLDDVVTNTVGMLVGWGIWKMLSSVGIVGNPLF